MCPAALPLDAVCCAHFELTRAFEDVFLQIIDLRVFFAVLLTHATLFIWYRKSRFVRLPISPVQ